MEIPPRELFADYARQLVERRTDWDGLHEFHTLVWDEEFLTPNAIALIDPGIDPDTYPKMMQELSYETIEKGVRPDGYALLVEAFAVDATERNAQLDADFAARRVKHRPDAFEVANAMVVDIRGRIWFASKRRDDEEGRITQWSASLGSERIGGQFPRALITIGCSTGVMVHGLPMPMPTWMQN